MPTNKAETILASFELPAEKAIKILKGQDVDTSGNWDAMMEFSGDRAFVISHVVNADILQDMLEGLTKALEEGVPFEEFKRNARDLLARRGWTGADADDESGQTADLTQAWRLELIYRNNLQNALNAGRRTGQLSVKDRRPYSVYSSVRDNRTTDECKGRDGVVLPTDDAWWDTNYPLNHHLCRGKVYTASERELTRDGLKISTDEYLATLPPPAKGFAQSPLDPYKPDTKKYPGPLSRKVEAAVGSTNSGKVSTKKAKPSVKDAAADKEWAKETKALVRDIEAKHKKEIAPIEAELAALRKQLAALGGK